MIEEKDYLYWKCGNLKAPKLTPPIIEEDEFLEDGRIKPVKGIGRCYIYKCRAILDTNICKKTTWTAKPANICDKCFKEYINKRHRNGK
jgi:hypothetical protein